MKKRFLKYISAILSVVLMATTFASCAPETPDNSGEMQNEIIVDNTNANVVSAYNKEGAYTLNIDAGDEIHDISDLLFGVFFEDINFAADGGLYAEMVANRSFEFTAIAQDDELYRWNSVNDAEISVKSDKKHSLNENNPNYLVIKGKADSKSGIENRGFLDGMSIVEGKDYKVSFYAKSLENYKGEITVNLSVDGKAVATETFNGVSAKWQKYSATLTSTQTANKGVTLQVLTEGGEVYFDMISLFPEDTYKNRENGLRADMCQLLEDLQPKFLRFPGGCVIEGYDINSAYSWKDSIGVGQNGLPLYFNGQYGDVAVRSQGVSLWTNFDLTDDLFPSFFSYGLGFYEYFQLAEDIGAVGVPVLNCGLYCQARGKGPVALESDEFKQYVQDMLDLVEFCRGGVNTTWGKVRASLGHPEPFELKYICIGNENWGQDYFVRYSAFLEAFNKAKAENPKLYEGLELIYSSGVDDGTSGADYISSYEYAQNELNKMNSTNAKDFAGATDHHYYNDPQWFYENADYYDEKNYKRDVATMTDTKYGGAINVFVGEYASWSNTLNSALSEAAYMTGLERNGDIVTMAAYAPLFSSTTARHWSPNLIWFNNSGSMGSINYYVQKLFSLNQGSAVLNHTFEGAKIEQETLKGKIGVGTWYTSAKFDNVVVKDLATGETLAEDTFNLFSKSDWDFATDGKWKIKKGALTNTTTEMNYSNTGSVAYFGDESWENYSFTVEATKLEGEEGFIIPFAVKDAKNNYFWNIGGWGNTLSALQQIENDNKTDKIVGTVKDCVIETGKTYKITVEVSDYNVKGYIDDELYFDYNCGSEAEAKAYTVVSNDDNGDIIIKLVNATEKASTVAVKIDNANVSDEAIVNQVAGDSLTNDNILGADQNTHITMKEFTLNGFSNEFNYTMPAYSVTSIRLKTIE
ncbi:MAG: carbohydrate binding domain-containing protein [Clostridia bacterium]|nr:carbohydrate binding domain-containing protein [Clostridia bacterium]